MASLSSSHDSDTVTLTRASDSLTPPSLLPPSEFVGLRDESGDAKTTRRTADGLRSVGCAPALREYGEEDVTVGFPEGSGEGDGELGPFSVLMKGVELKSPAITTESNFLSFTSSVPP
mmetsp:Transcript_11613/g.22320  ORF Transcript_11613/g.22320 Transcript_11613/m.22320 type:complete len:118 (-) Transcript_11613:1005-1358(-)